MSEETTARKSRKQNVGVVISDKRDKTIVVMVETRRPHPLYGKVIREFKKFYSHDEENAASQGDTVRIMATRPLSKTKRWRLVEILVKKGEGA